MGFTQPDLPKVDPDTFMQQPLMHRMKVLSLHWVERGFGTPRMVHVIYILKLLTFYLLGGVVIATATSHLPAFWHVAHWWNQPIVYEKAVLWTVLLETVGVAGSWGPLAGKFKPMTGGILFWARTGTIRLRPWKRVPLTAGDRRTPVDVALYLALIVSVIVPLVAPGVHSASLSAAVPGNTSGLVSPVLIVPAIVLLVLNGLRDKIIFLAARGEQYLPALVFFTVLPIQTLCGYAPSRQRRGRSRACATVRSGIWPVVSGRGSRWGPWSGTGDQKALQARRAADLPDRMATPLRPPST